MSSTTGKVTPQVKLEDRHEERVVVLGRVLSRDKSNVSDECLACVRNNRDSCGYSQERNGGSVGHRVREVMDMEE